MQGAPRGFRPPDGARAPSAARDDARTPSAARPGESGPLILQSTTVEPSTSLWEQVFPATTWASVLGGRTVTVTVEGGRATLLGARDGQRTELGRITAGRRAVSLAELEQDWLWVEPDGGGVDSVTWSIEADLALPPVTVVVPTYRREQDAVAQVRRFTQMGVVDAVVVIDQAGTLESHGDFQRLLAQQETIHLVTQPNLGGSGGYARGMHEASQNPASAVLFSDDDAVISEESLRRMLTYQSLAGRPTIVGTPLFSSQEPSRLITHTEAVEPGVFQWKAADRVRGSVDLAGTTPADWTFLSQRVMANYTGWWGTLFPPGTAAELGLPVPLFLKWDDAEYGLRATARGYDHAVLPGTAVHHPPWNAYRTQMTWTARVLHRNRLAIAAAYGAGRGVIGSSLIHQLKHILAGHLLTAELWEEGIAAFRAGPDWLGSDLQHARTDGAQVVADWYERWGAAPELTPTHASPLPLVPALLRALVRLVRRDGPPRVVLAVPADAVHWRTTLGADAVVVTEAQGAPLSAFMVSGSASRRALARTLRSHAAMAWRWAALRRRYHRALPRHTTAERWSELFTAPPDDETTGTR